MAIKFNLKNQKIFFGNKEVIKVYKGNKKVYGGTTSRVWYHYAYVSSKPSAGYTYTKTYDQSGYSPTRAEVEDLMTSSFPPANIPVGTTGWIYFPNLGQYHLLMVIQEE